ncbi:MAG: glycerophosphodiester phosphodiesterase [Bacteriovoracaceae bacterium]|jgi:glycerophosphoryl diester phosphodiesterase|nr:glycerophosphodiester phosphodiesterase [Bacteriovoracaceae bacterium]
MNKNFVMYTLLTLFSSCASNDLLVIAHRGASGYLPEHTLEAVALAHGLNPDYIEPDLVLTRDNILVVLHDIHLDTVTNVRRIYPKKKRKDGRFYAIDFTLKQLKRLHISERINPKTKQAVFPKRFPRGASSFRIATFAEYIELVQGLNKSRKMNIGIYPEIKSPAFHHKHKKQIEKIVFKVLDKYGYTKGKKKIFLQCFDPRSLKFIKKTFKPKFPLIQLIADDSWKEANISYKKMLTRKGLKHVKTYADGIGAWIPQLLSTDVHGAYLPTSSLGYAKDLGLTIHAYTLRADQLPEYAKDVNGLANILSREGVDGVFTDFPDLINK